MLLSAGHSLFYSISRWGAAMADGRFPQDVFVAIGEIYLHAPKGFSCWCIPFRLCSHSWQDLRDADRIRGPVHGSACFTLCAKIRFGWSDYKWIVQKMAKTYRDPVIRTTKRQVWEMTANASHNERPHNLVNLPVHSQGHLLKLHMIDFFV